QLAERVERQLGLHRALVGEATVRTAAGAEEEDEPAEERTWRGAGRAGASPPPAPPGYEIEGELGRGGVGVVYKARHLALNRVVALKVLRDGALADAADARRFRHEAEVVARLRHPNIVSIYEVGRWGRRPYLALEHVEGGSLREWLGGNPQAPRPAAELVEVLARAIHHAHQE